MTMQTFINLPVQDLARATGFFTALGFSFDPQFTNDSSARMIVNDSTSVLLLVEPSFQEFVRPQDVADTTATREVIVGLAVESRAQVDDLVGKAGAAGAEVLGGPEDQGFMYMQGFRDLDGHQWSFLHMDFSAMSG